MRAIELDSLLGNKFDQATFHDSELISFQISLDSAQATFDFRIPHGIIEDRLNYTPGRLIFSGLQFFDIKPTRYYFRSCEPSTLWITADGPLPDPNVNYESVIPKDLSEDAFCHYFYSSTTNNFIVVAATHAEFSWLEDTPLA